MNAGARTALSYAEFRDVWEQMSEQQRERVLAKAQWEAMTPWAVLNEWPSMRFEGDQDA